MKRSLSRYSLLLGLALIPALSSCRPEPEPPSPEEISRQEVLKNIRSASAALEYRRILAGVAGASETEKQDFRDADARLTRLEERAERLGLLGPDIDPEIAAGREIGSANATTTIQERAAAAPQPTEAPAPEVEKPAPAPGQ